MELKNAIPIPVARPYLQEVWKRTPLREVKFNIRIMHKLSQTGQRKFFRCFCVSSRSDLYKLCSYRRLQRFQLMLKFKKSL